MIGDGCEHGACAEGACVTGGGLQMGCSVAGGESAGGSASAGGANAGGCIDSCLVVVVQPESMCSLIRESGTLRLQMGHSVNREPTAMVVLMAGVDA